MEIRILSDADEAAREGARVIAETGRAAVAERGRFIMAVSGGRTPIPEDPLAGDRCGQI